MHNRSFAAVSNAFLAPVKKVGAQQGFYNVPEEITRELVRRERKDEIDLGDLGEVVVSLEPALGRIESEASAVVGRIVRSESLSCMSSRDRAILAFFTTVQFLRVPRQRDLFAQLTDALRDRIGAFVEEKGADREAELERLGLGSVTPSTQAHMHLAHVSRAYEYLPYFWSKTWFLHRAPADAQLYIGDNPITLWNHGPKGGSGIRGFGLGTLKSEIAMPLCPRLCLVMLCPSMIEESRAILRTVDELRINGRAVDASLTAPHQELLLAAESGRPIDLPGDEATHFNWRQVYMASRYVCASEGRFEVAHQTLAADPDTRSGPRIQIS